MNKTLMYTLYWDLKVRDGCQEEFESLSESQKEKYIRKEVRKMMHNKGEKLFRLTYWMRLRQFYPRFSLRWLIATLFYKVELQRYPIRMNCYPGRGFHIVHPSYMYLNAEKIGSFFTAYQGVTLGVDKTGGKPVIGDFVTVYTNAVIGGPVTIGDGCVIGANAFVNQDLPPNTIVIAGGTILKKRKEDLTQTQEFAVLNGYRKKEPVPVSPGSLPPYEEERDFPRYF